MNPRTKAAPHHYLHLTPEELAALPPDELLQACLEYRSLLLAMMGILYTPEIGFTMRTVALDLMYLQTQRWRDLGATHVAINTMGAGLASLQEHFETIRHYREAVKN